MTKSESARRRVLVLLAEGAEEMEHVITVDVLRRAEIEVVVAGLAGSGPVRCSRGVIVTPDVRLEDELDADGTTRENFDCVVLPGGGPGTEALIASTAVGHLLRSREAARQAVAAICAAPLALCRHGVFGGRAVTSHPSVRGELNGWCSRYLQDAVVVDGLLTTSRGPGTAFEFAFELVGQLVGSERVVAVRAPMVFADR